MPKTKEYYNGRCIIEDYFIQVKRQSFKNASTNNYASFDAVVFTRRDKNKVKENGEPVDYYITPPARLLKSIRLAMQYLKYIAEETKE